MSTPTDTQLLDWLERRGVDFIGFTDNTGLDIVNSDFGLRAELIQQMQEQQHAGQVL